MRLTVLCLAAVGGATARSDLAGANPIRKVVTLMQNMQKEIEAEGAKEKELFDKFMCFCTGNNDALEKSVADGEAAIAEYESKVTEGTAEKGRLTQEVATHKQDLAQATDDLSEAATLRKKESAEFDAREADDTTNIQAMSKAIPALEKGMGSASLMQMPGGVFDRVKHIAEVYGEDFDRKTVLAFLEQSGDYVPQSGQIVGILKAMLDDMEAELKTAKADEASAASGYAELKASKEAQASASKEAIQTKTVRMGELALEIAQAQDGLEDTTKEVADNKKFLANLATDCKNKEAEWAERSKLRAEEVEAISQAIGILNDDDALDVFKKAVPAAFEQETRLGLIQVVGQSAGQSAARVARVQAIMAKVQKSLKKSGHSPRLVAMLFNLKTKLRRQSRAIARGRSTGDFDEIGQMVDGMVVVEQEEQHNDDVQKPWCLGEFDKNDREDKEEHKEISKLEAEMSEDVDSIAALEGEIKALTEEIAGLDKSVAEATEQRKQEHQDYIESVQLSQTAMGLIEKAKQRLVKFYNPTLYKAAPVKKEMTMEEKIIEAGSASFLQMGRVVRRVRVTTRKQPEMPETFGKYEKKSEKSGGVMALMDSIVKEMESDMKDAEYDEKTAQKDYAELMSDSQESRAQNAKSITEKETAKASIVEKKQMAKEKEARDYEDLENIQAEVSNLHVKCDLMLEQFDMKKEARATEIEGLKSAKAILAGAK